VRILFASAIGGLGGAELFLLEMLEELRQRVPEWELHLLLGGDGPLIERAKSLGVTCHLSPLPSALAEWGDTPVRVASENTRPNRLKRGWHLASGLREASRQLREVLRRVDPDIVHSNGLKYHALTGWTGCGRARLVWFQHDYLGSRRLLSRGLPWLGRFVEFLWANSHSVADDLRRLMPRTPIRVLHCGIDLDRFSPGPSDPEWLDRQCDPPAETTSVLRIGLVATYARWKGQDRFLETAARLRQRHPNQPMRFYLVGGPIYATAGSQFTRSELVQMANELGIADVVRFIPYQADTPRVYRSLDIVVHASRHPEPFGRTILEAMACGRAVIAVEAGGAAEIFAADRSALGIAADDAEALSQAVEMLVNDRGRRLSLGHAARIRAGHFSRSRMGEALLDAYERLEPPGHGRRGPSDIARLIGNETAGRA
jgi:glycosyltransferase involved in cell wall biosynthesis